MKARLLQFPRSLGRTPWIYGHDVVMAAVSFVAALLLRLGGLSLVPLSSGQILVATTIFTLICAVVLRIGGPYQGLWRYASTHDMLSITRVVTVATLIFVAAQVFIPTLHGLPRTLPVVIWFVLLVLLAAPRFAYRVWQDRSFNHMLGDSRSHTPVLLVGAGDQADAFIRMSERDRRSDFDVVGLLSTSPHQVGKRLRHAKVLGTPDQLPDIMDTLQRVRGAVPKRVIVACDDLPPTVLASLLEQCQSLGLTLARSPRLDDLREDIGTTPSPRPIAIEDLLGRPQSELDHQAMAHLIEGRNVLVTGAGGSIGSELVRQISALQPASVTLVDACEYALYSIDMEMHETWPDVSRNTFLADVRDIGRMDQIVAETRPQLVLHAAALKHVPLVEANPLEGIRTNILGTRNMARICRRHGVDMMVLISTDKAVNPTNVMGATKRVAELYCKSADTDGHDSAQTRFVTVRFGNVLGSTGSVVPLFRRQLEQGGPLTVTHPDMTRFFMTIREAVELVLQASAMGVGNPDLDGRIYVLNMGNPIKIVDLARQMIRLAGLRPDTDVSIEFTGLRPGEKLHEELLYESETPVTTGHDGVMSVTQPQTDGNALNRAIDALEQSCTSGDQSQALRRLHDILPEYLSSATRDKHQSPHQ